MKNPIYEPSGAAKEYGDLALNIYTGCPHGCTYCFAPQVLHRERAQFHSDVRPRDGIVDALKQKLTNGEIKDKLIHLCFSCDPYPRGYDTSITREVIMLLKESGNHVQILTKNGVDAVRDFDLLDKDDWFGVTYAGYDDYFSVPSEEPNADTPFDRLAALITAKNEKINTWVSCEPVLEPDFIYHFIRTGDYIDRFKIGKLNYHPSDINWAEFGWRAEALCIRYNRNYYIKDALRQEMNKQNA